MEKRKAAPWSRGVPVRRRILRRAAAAGGRARARAPRGAVGRRDAGSRGPPGGSARVRPPRWCLAEHDRHDLCDRAAQSGGRAPEWQIAEEAVGPGVRPARASPRSRECAAAMHAPDAVVQLRDAAGTARRGRSTRCKRRTDRCRWPRTGRLYHVPIGTWVPLDIDTPTAGRHEPHERFPRRACEPAARPGGGRAAPNFTKPGDDRGLGTV